MDLFDSSAWLKKHGGNAKSYYSSYLSLFVTHGVLFENFLSNENEGKFFINVFMPTFDFLTAYYGYKPIIVQAIPEADIDDLYWWCYPNYVKKFI